MRQSRLSRRGFGVSCAASSASLLLAGTQAQAQAKEKNRPPVSAPAYGLSSKEYLLDAIENAPRRLSFERASLQPEEWWKKLHTKLLSLLDLDNLQLKPPSAHIESSIQKDGFQITEIVYQVEDNLWCPALLYRPDTPHPKGPAVLACHGHGIGIEDDLYTYIDGFAKRGYTVFAPNVRDFGERAFEVRGPHECPHVEPLYNMLGWSSMGLKLKDLLLGFELLKTQEHVDPKRIGCAGLSMGGGLSLFLSAIQPEIAVSLISGFLSTYKGLMFDKRNCPGYVVNGILQYCDLYDVAGLIAPRPLVVESAIQDPCFVHEDTLNAYGKTADIYKAFGAEDKIVLDEFEGGHMFHGTVTYPWFDRFLKDKP